MKPLSDQVWIFDFDVHMAPGMQLSARSILYKEDGKVMIISPGPFTPEDFKKIRAWGEIVAIVSPNLWHTKWAKPTLDEFPDARYFRDDAVVKEKPELQGRGEMFKKMSFLNFKDMEFLEIRGVPKVQECVFYFKKDNLLCVTDMVFNVQHPKGILSKIVTTLAGTKGRLAVSHFLSMLIKDKKAFSEDIRKMLEWNFDKVYMAHGEPLTADAKFQLEKVLAKHL